MQKQMLAILILCFFPNRSFAEAKSDLLAPALSLIVPGLDQWWEGDYLAASGYTGMFLGGAVISGQAAASLEDRKKVDPDFNPNEQLDSKDNDIRRLMLGSQISFAAGSFSALHAFSSAAESRKSDGQYSFLGEKLTVADTAMAPFRFSYLTRSSTLIPLGVIGTIALLAGQTDSEDVEKVVLTGQDYGFAGGFSYLAGTHEEALFRGWLMPVFREYVAGDSVSNILQSILFAAAHMGSVDIPIAQLLLGYHLGYVTQSNGWNLGEAAFIHTWWDVAAFLTSFSVLEKQKGSEATQVAADRNRHQAMMTSKGVISQHGRSRTLPMLRLPPLVIRF